MGTELTDEKLMQCFSERQDRNAFEELVRRWDRRVFAFLAKTSGDAEAAKDLRQEVFIRVLKYGPTYDGKSPFSTWLFRIARNVLATWYAKRERSRIVERPAPDESLRAIPDSAPSPYMQVLSAEQKAEIDCVVQRLKPEERELIVLRMELDLNYREMGEILDMPETTVKSRVYSLLKRIRTDIQRTAMTDQPEELKSCERM